LAAIEAGNDVAIGSRALERSLIETHQSPVREIAGMIFNAFVRLLTGLPFHDTQCCFKAFRRERRRVIFEQQRLVTSRVERENVGARSSSWRNLTSYSDAQRRAFVLRVALPELLPW
jgi:hypothetical protein